MRKQREHADAIAPYLALAYHHILRRDDELWAAEVLEFPGCFSSGDTAAEAIENLEDAMADWLRSEIDAGHEIPEPIDEETYSGRVTLRITPTMHRRAVLRAQVEGVSLNRLLSAAIAGYLGEMPALVEGNSLEELLSPAERLQALLPKPVTVSVHGRVAIVNQTALRDPLDTRTRAEVERMARTLGLSVEFDDRRRLNRVGW